MIKSGSLKYCAVVIFIMCSCSNEKETFELKEWLLEQELMKTKAITLREDCDSLISLLKDLQDEEFRAQMYLRLAECYVKRGDEKNAEVYLKNYFSEGKHISWIDTIYFSSILPSTKEYEHLRESFWKKKDTFYFSEIEERYSRDQASVQGYVANRTDELEKIEKGIFKNNSEYLLKITDSVGFPWQPGPNYFEKERFRIGIQPDLIAVHAPIEDKIIHQQNAIEAAKKGEISWRVPIFIGVTFFTQSSTRGGPVMPLRFLHFDDQKRLNVEDSYLQLYSVKKFVQDNGISGIKFQASTQNTLDEEIILQQLQDLKKAMVEEFGWPEQALVISTDPDEAENRQIGNYDYTFTTF